VFTARYALSPYIKQIHFVLKGLNTEIAKQLNITTVLDKIQGEKRNWIQYVNRMLRNRLPSIMNAAYQKAEGTREDH
jgi:hypothetical protein